MFAELAELAESGCSASSSGGFAINFLYIIQKVGVAIELEIRSLTLLPLHRLI